MRVTIVFNTLLIANILVMSTILSAMHREESKNSIEAFQEKREHERRDRQRLTATVLQLLQNRGDVNRWPDATEGNTLLHEAAKRGLVNTLRLLVDAKSDVDARNLEGKTPLHLAAENLKLDVVKILLYAGANYSLATPEGRTVRTILAIDQGDAFEDYLLSGLIKSGKCTTYVDQIIEEVNAPSGVRRKITMIDILTSRPKLSDIDEKEEERVTI